MKSHVRDVLSILTCVFMDAARKCSTDKVQFGRDLVTIRSRVKDEGLSFITIALPNFGRDFESALEAGKVSPSSFQGWKRRGCLPAFLRGFTTLVFDTSGKIKEETDVAEAIEGIRQITYAFKKLHLACSPQRQQAAIKSFRDCEAGLAEFAMREGEHAEFVRISHLLYGTVFGYHFDSRDAIPKHGPGSTAEGIRGNQKYLQHTWYERLEPFFPVDSFVLPSLCDIDEQLEVIRMVPEDEELPVRVTLVPKTLKTPRVIAIEPVCMQYTQQALARLIIDRLETSYMTTGHINFRNQSINRELAMSSSLDRSLATIDLSEASDRVPASMVFDMLSFNPDLRDAVFACRSRSAKLPSGDILPLRKFASMGSALCFPIEAMYFFVALIHGLLRRAQLPVTLRNIKSVSESVYVYGDDLIVPADAVEAIVEVLQLYNCKVNTNKSFWKGNFRESCGMDAFKDVEVTPIYVRELRPLDGRYAAKYVLSRIACSNNFYNKGYWITADHLKRVVERMVGILPLVLEESPGVGWVNFQRGYSVQRWSKKLHRYEVRTLVATPSYQKDSLDGYPALQKFFLTSLYRDATDKVDEEHLQRTARYGTVSTKRRWTTPY